MKEWKVNCELHSIYQAMLKLAQDHGWKGSAVDCIKSTTRRKYLAWGKNLELVGWSKSPSYCNYPEITIVEAFHLLESDPPPLEPAITCAGSTVKFHDDGSIKVGCQDITREEIESIYERSTKSMR